MPMNNKRLKVGRREFIKLASGSAAAFLFYSKALGGGTTSSSSPSSVELSRFTEQLPIPPVIDATQGGTFNLAMAPSTHSFHGSMPSSPTWGYGGASYLGPTINAKLGVPIAVHAENQLGEHPLAFAIDTELHGARAEDTENPRASLHLHGGNTEPGSDGHPEDTFLPGEGKTYHYVNDQEAANLWYHDHALGITRLNVMAGLAGFYLLRDDWDTGAADNPIGLPAGQYEVPLVIQDRMFSSDGAMDYPAGPLQIWSPEFFGDVAVVNGKVFPNLDVDRGLYRFRVINGSNARVYSLYLSNNRPFFQIGGDGGLLNVPVPLTRLILAPGERADLLIDFSNEAPGTKVVLRNTAPAPFPDGPRSERRGGLPLREILQFTVGASAGFSEPIPLILRENPIIPLPSPVRVRNLSLVEIMDMESDEPLMALLNNLP